MTATVQPYQPPSTRPASIGQQTAVEQSRAIAEVQAAVVVAQQIPRDIQRAVAEMQESCSRLAMAKQAFYQVPNRGNGPSVHLLRELARIWGNVQHGTHELARDDDKGESEIQAFAWDVQTNTRTSRTFVVPHERMKGKGRQQLTDLGDIQNNNNNVGARAVRECISNVLPRWFTEEAQNRCHATLEHGEGKPLAQRVTEMLGAFKGIGITESQIETKLAKKRGQWDAGDIAQLGIAYTSITRDGYDKDEMFPPVNAGVSADDIAASSKRKPKAEPAQQEIPADVLMVSAEQIAELTELLTRAAGEDLATQADFLAAWRKGRGNEEPLDGVGDLSADEAEALLVDLKGGK
ncbi:MAG: hypothetical protein WBB07_17450 [Mycobacterium sp.]